VPSQFHEQIQMERNAYNNQTERLTRREATEMNAEKDKTKKKKSEKNKKTLFFLFFVLNVYAYSSRPSMVF